MSKLIGDNEFAFVVTANIFAWIENNSDGHIEDMPTTPSILQIDVSDYAPEEGTQWNIDDYEARLGRIYAPANRRNWKLGYRLARALRQGVVYLRELDTEISLPGIVTFS